MTTLYHITTESQAAEARQTGVYVPREYDADGFVHCSYAHQVAGVANRFYANRSGLVLLKILPSALNVRVIDENLEGGTELFPHVYGPIPWGAVTEVIPFCTGFDGKFQFPTDR